MSSLIYFIFCFLCNQSSSKKPHPGGNTGSIKAAFSQQLPIWLLFMAGRMIAFE
jgi:hypothetical protein